MKTLLAVLFSLVATVAMGQSFPAEAEGGGGTPYDGGSVTNPFLMPDGTQALPGLALASNPDTGFFRYPAGVGFNLSLDDNTTSRVFQSGTSTYYDFRNPNLGTAGVGQRATRFRISDAYSRWSFYQNGDDTGAAAVDFTSFPGNYNYVFIDTAEGDSGYLYLRNSTTEALEIRWTDSDTGGVEAGKHLALRGPVVPSGTNTITLPDNTGTLHLDGTTLTLPNDGTALLPSLLFAGDLTTGIYQDQSSEINFSSAADELMMLKNTGTTSFAVLYNMNDTGFESGFQYSGVASGNSVRLYDFGTSGTATSWGTSTTDTYLTLSAPSGGGANRIDFYSDDTNENYIGFNDAAGTQYVRLQGPANASGTNTITIPDDTGTVPLLGADQSGTAVSGTTAWAIGDGDGDDAMIYMDDAYTFITNVDFDNGIGVHDNGTISYVDIFSVDYPTILNSDHGAVSWGNNSVTLTDSTNVVVFSKLTASSQRGGGTLSYNVFAEDATDHSVRTGEAKFSYSNKGGTLICGATVGTENVVASGGATLTCTADCNVSTQTVQLRLNCASSLTTTVFTAYPAIQLDGGGAVSAGWSSP